MTQTSEPLSGDLESHYVEPGSSTALCAEPTATSWKPATSSDTTVTCDQCRIQKRWLPASGELDRDANLDVMIEPWTAGQRRHVTGNDDPGRGRLHRPANLQLCVACGGLRGPYRGFDNLCRCDRDIWDRHPVPRCGDLSNNIDFCRSCLSAAAAGCSRWTSYYCDQCRPHVVVLNRLAGRCVVPIGPHSMMNGVFHGAAGGPVLDAQASAFADQLSTLFRNQTSLHDLADDRIRARLHDFGVGAHAILVRDYLGRCAAEGWDAERGFVDFVLSIGEGLDEQVARDLWNTSPNLVAE
jgi:hypothetical protein